LPRFALEPPPEYVAFVEQHLEPLRQDAARVADDEISVDQLYSETLTDVAARWTWFELLRTRLGRPDAAEAYLHRSFERHSQRWQHAQLAPIEVDRWRVAEWDPDSQQAPVDIQVWRPDSEPEPAPYRVWQPDASAHLWTSAAVRLAPHVQPPDKINIAPIAEAAVAWWHAYEASRRRKLIVVLVVLLGFGAVLARFQQA
jgi:hypothetical protein